MAKEQYKHRIYDLKITPKKYRLKLRFTIVNNGEMFLRGGKYYIGNRYFPVKFLIAKPLPKAGSISGFGYMPKKEK